MRHRVCCSDECRASWDRRGQAGGGGGGGGGRWYHLYSRTMVQLVMFSLLVQLLVADTWKLEDLIQMPDRVILLVVQVSLLSGCGHSPCMHGPTVSQMCATGRPPLHGISYYLGHCMCPYLSLSWISPSHSQGAED